MGILRRCPCLTNQTEEETNTTTLLSLATYCTIPSYKIMPEREYGADLKQAIANSPKHLTDEWKYRSHGVGIDSYAYSPSLALGVPGRRGFIMYP
jgi:hypothetical protein